ncbi:hypothetical protein [Flavivirga spongiicola]|uniref:Uncharacterized protein n=1 Tax=Flavivirga spongiicola TaxID=421621 RepID=A0ABU7XT79_9FLAO|nr:hypothetical protein [Flavivirga sp. MEBiC05379]MDO5978997.1 hypothetical protein [Flavivirga sp. MEBiC05379]
MYQNIFAVDKVSFKDRKNTDEASSEYALNNYNYYKPSLEKDFYLRVFLKKSLFEIDILELEDFLSFQYENSKDEEKLIKTLKLKILPSTEKIINNANFSLEGGDYFDQTALEDGFVKSDGLVKHREFEFSMFYHWAACKNLIEDLQERKTILLDYIKMTESLKNNNNLNLLNWHGKPSHLAFFISQLIENGYIEAPKKENGEIHYKALAIEVQNSFKIRKEVKRETLSKFMSPDNEKNQSLKISFEKAEYYMPHSKLLG